MTSNPHDPDQTAVPMAKAAFQGSPRHLENNRDRALATRLYGKGQSVNLTNLFESLRRLLSKPSASACSRSLVTPKPRTSTFTLTKKICAPR